MSSETQQNAVNGEHDAEYLAAFSEFSGGSKPPENDDEPKEPATEASADEPKPGAEAPAGSGEPPPAAPADEAGAQQQTAPPDPWESAPPELKALYEQTVKERDDFQHRAKSDAERVSALTRKVVALSQTKETAAPKGSEAAPEKGELDEMLASMEERFPDIGKALRAIVEAQKKQLEPIQQTVTAVSEVAQADKVAAELSALEVRHPDWRDLAVDQSFSAWAEAQPETIQKMASSWDATEVSAALDLFKAQRAAAMGTQQAAPEAKPAEQQQPDARRQQQLEGGADVRSKPAPAASGAPDEFTAAAEHFMAKKAAEMAAARALR